MLTRNRRKEIVSLQRRKGRDRLGAFLLEGVRSVESALRAGAPVREVIVTEDMRRSPRLAPLLDRPDLTVSIVPETEFGALSDVRTSQGVLAVAARPASPPDLETARMVLAFDGVQDPGNVGTLLRTAAWFGVDAALAGPGTADFYGPKVVRAAMGGLWDLDLDATADLAARLAALRDHGFACYGADLEGRPLVEWRPARPSVLVMGSEAHGLSPDVLALLNERVVIAPPPAGVEMRGVESLNVAVAGGILIHHWARSGVAT